MTNYNSLILTQVILKRFYAKNSFNFYFVSNYIQIAHINISLTIPRKQKKKQKPRAKSECVVKNQVNDLSLVWNISIAICYNGRDITFLSYSECILDNVYRIRSSACGCKNKRYCMRVSILRRILRQQCPGIHGGWYSNHAEIARKSHLIIPFHDNVIKWKYFPCYWPFVRGIHRSPSRTYDVTIMSFSVMHVTP